MFYIAQLFDLAMCMPNIPWHSLCHFGCQNFNILYRSSLDPDMINYLCIFHVLHCPTLWASHVHAKYPLIQPMSFRLPEFQYSVPIFARPWYNELHMYFLCFTLPNSLSLPCACQISLTKAMSFGCQNFNILYRSSLDPDMINYLCIFHVLALPKSWNLPCACQISLDTVYVISVARISIFCTDLR